MRASPGFDDLPPEVHTLIFGKLRVSEQFALTQVCRRWRDMLSPGLLMLQVRVPPLLLARWLGSADDDSRGAGVHVDPFRPVRVTLMQRSPVPRVSGRLPKSGLATGAEAGAAAGGATHSECAAIEVWAYAKECEAERLDKDLMERRTTVMTLVTRVPAGLESWDVTKSSVGSGHRVPMSNVLVGIGARFLPGLTELQASGGKHLKWLLAPATLQSADLNSCPELENLFAASPRVEVLDVTNCRKLNPDSFSWMCGVEGEKGPESGTGLKHLHCSYMTQLPESVLQRVVQFSSRLVSLSIRGIGTDPVIRSIRDSCRCLAGVDTAFSPSISGRALWAMIEGSPVMQRCNIRGCRKVSANDYWGTAHELRGRLLGIAGGASADSNQLSNDKTLTFAHQ